MTAVAADIALALGRLMRGIVHEALNPLNSIVMTAQLGELSVDDREAVTDCLQTIGRTARESGAWLRELGNLAATGDCAPAGDADIDAALATARGLLGSRASRAGCELVFGAAEGDTQIPLNATAAGVAAAFVVDVAIAAGAGRVELAGTERSLQIVTDAPAASLLPQGDADAAAARRLAQAVCRAHGGTFELEDDRAVMRLA